MTLVSVIILPCHGTDPSNLIAFGSRLSSFPSSALNIPLQTIPSGLFPHGACILSFVGKVD
jgi:hypothetical protein